MAAEFERAVTEGTDSPVRRNLAEARDAIALIDAARRSSFNNGIEINLPVKSAS